MDKAREAIAEIVKDIIKQDTNNLKVVGERLYGERADQILGRLRSHGWHHEDDEVEGMVVKGIDESKFPMFRFKCPRGHGSWTEKKHPNLGRGICKVCEKETDEYNAMLKGKNYNWPVSFNHGLDGIIINKGGEWETTRPATIKDVLEGRAPAHDKEG